jgi:hypothetical protein
MSDKSPKSKNKLSNQKQAKGNAVAQKKKKFEEGKKGIFGKK